MTNSSYQNEIFYSAKIREKGTGIIYCLETMEDLGVDVFEFDKEGKAKGKPGKLEEVINARGNSNTTENFNGLTLLNSFVRPGSIIKYRTVEDKIKDVEIEDVFDYRGEHDLLR